MLETIGKNYIFYILVIVLSMINAYLIMYTNQLFFGYGRKKNRKVKTYKFLDFTLIKNYINRYLIYFIINLLILMPITYVVDIKEDLGKLQSIAIWLQKIAIIPVLISISVIDFKVQKIPNRLTLLLFQITAVTTLILITFGNRFLNDSFLGLVVTLLIFGIMIIVGRIIIKKESLGIGDIKLMIPISLVVGAVSVIEIAIISFFLVFVASIVLEIWKSFKKNILAEDYIAFSPFLAVSTIIVMLIEKGSIINMIANIF